MKEITESISLRILGGTPDSQTNKQRNRMRKPMASCVGVSGLLQGVAVFEGAECLWSRGGRPQNFVTNDRL
jgi:hypothetical protein